MERIIGSITFSKKDTPCMNCLKFMECRTTSDLVVFEMKHGVRVLIDTCDKQERKHDNPK